MKWLAKLESFWRNWTQVHDVEVDLAKLKRRWRSWSGFGEVEVEMARLKWRWRGWSGDAEVEVDLPKLKLICRSWSWFAEVEVYLPKLKLICWSWSGDAEVKEFDLEPETFVRNFVRWWPRNAAILDKAMMTTCCYIFSIGITNLPDRQFVPWLRVELDWQPP